MKLSTDQSSLRIQAQLDIIEDNMRKAKEDRAHTRERLDRLCLFFQEMDTKIDNFLAEYWSRHKKDS